jgi:phage shock protein PspC (stress-responsive transcriptional regulator)
MAGVLKPVCESVLSSLEVTTLAEIKRVYKLKEGRIIDGVCGGFAAYIGVEAVWVRVGWAILALAGGIGIVAYLLAMYLFPRAETGDAGPPVRAKRSAGPLIAGLILIGVGAAIVLRAVGILDYGFWGAWHIAWVILWPIALIGGGLFLLLIYWRQTSATSPKFRRVGWDKMVLGVCGGLSRLLKTDPNIVRLAFALLIILSRGVGLVVYLVIGLLTPEVDEGESLTPPSALKAPVCGVRCHGSGNATIGNLQVRSTWAREATGRGAKPYVVAS